jgi:hypothetical protein
MPLALRAAGSAVAGDTDGPASCHLAGSAGAYLLTEGGGHTIAPNTRVNKQADALLAALPTLFSDLDPSAHSQSHLEPSELGSLSPSKPPSRPGSSKVGSRPPSACRSAAHQSSSASLRPSSAASRASERAAASAGHGGGAPEFHLGIV